MKAKDSVMEYAYYSVNLMLNNSDFVDLHTHTSFSLLDGTTTPEKIAEESAKIGRKYLSITDHGSIDGWVEHTKGCEKVGIKPIYGIELFMIERFEDRKTDRQKNLHLTAIAKTEEGQRKLIQACGFAHSEGIGKWGFMKRPFLPMDYPLRNNWAGDIIIATGCASSPFWNAEKGIDLLGDYYDAFKSDLYAEVMPIYDWDDQKTVNANAFQACETFGIKPIVTCDIHYLCKDDSEFHNVVIGLQQGSGTTYKNQKWKFETHCSHIHTTEQLNESLRKLSLGEETIRPLILNTKEIAEKTFNKLKSTPVVLPPVLNIKDESDESEQFVQLVVAGFESAKLPSTDIYISRLEREIEVIRSKGFVRYFLMVWDTIKWAKSNGICIGPSRGSVGGSLVAYCLGITNLDPIKYGLFFERFLAPGRNDYPDIDIDIDSRNRHLIEEYLKGKYGSDRVAHVSTFGRLMGRAAIRDVSRYYQVPLAEADKMSKSIIHKYEGEEGAEETVKLTMESGEPIALEFNAKYPRVIEYAQKLEGLTKSYGVHASGYVISNDSLQNSIRCYLANRNGQQTVNWSGPDLEYMGFIKLDLLGLSTLSAIAECVELIKKNKGISIDLTKIPMDDKPTFQMLCDGHTATVFHFNTGGYTKYCKEMKPDNFLHMAAVMALWKPGPIAAGMTEGYRDCKLGLKEPVYYSPSYKEITEETYGYIIYQEQIVLLLTKLAGFSWKDADKTRKDISKKLGLDKIAAIEEPFVQGCLKNGTLDEDTARALWKQIVFFGVYVFNKSHSIGYGMLAYWTAYLKAHYPVEWICAYLNYGSADKEDKRTGEKNIDVALREAKRLGVTIKTPDINKSEVIWSVDGNALRVGLKDVAMVGEVAQADIAKMKAAGPIKSLKDFIDRIEKDSAIDKTVVQNLLYTGAFDELYKPSQFPMTPDPYELKARNEFDIFWHELGLKRFPKYLEQPYGILCGPEFFDEKRKELLKFNSISIDDGTTLRQIGNITGMIVEKTDEDEWFLTNPKTGTKYTRLEAETCQFGETGIRLVQSPSPLNEIRAIRNEHRECKKCDLRNNCRLPVSIDLGQTDIMLIGESSGYYEDKYGKPFANKNAGYLWECFKEFDIDRKMVTLCNVVSCKAKDGEKPTKDQILGCEWLSKYIQVIKPKFIAAFGNIPLFFFTGREKGINSMNGKTEWSTKYKCWTTFIITPNTIGYRPEELSTLRYGISEFTKNVLQFI